MAPRTHPTHDAIFRVSRPRGEPFSSMNNPKGFPVPNNSLTGPGQAKVREAIMAAEHATSPSCNRELEIRWYFPACASACLQAESTDVICTGSGVQQSPLSPTLPCKSMTRSDGGIVCCQCPASRLDQVSFVPIGELRMRGLSSVDLVHE